MDAKNDDFYKRFKEKLSKNQELPGDYIFKFIVDTNLQKIAQLQKIFDESRPKISSKTSRNNKYTSLTIKTYVLDADEVIGFYKEASKIPGLISL